MGKKYPFRSILDLHGYGDATVIKGDCKVDTSGYEPLERLVKRMMRGERIRPRNDLVYTGDAFSDTIKEGFDMADVPALLVKNEASPVSDSTATSESATEATAVISDTAKAE